MPLLTRRFKGYVKTLLPFALSFLPLIEDPIEEDWNRIAIGGSYRTGIETMATTELYLIRHGLAGEHGSYPNDNERPLTEEGKQKTRQVADRLLSLNLNFDLILTSPLVRAQQTADILLKAGLSQQLQEASYLAPGGSIDAWLEWLRSQNRSENLRLALVGHEPGLSEWAETLLWGKSSGALTLKKAGIIGLTLPEHDSPVGNSSLFWLTPPRFLL